MYKKGTVYLVDPIYLDFIKNLLLEYPAPFLEIGPGKGHISRVIPDPKSCVEKDEIHKPYLKNLDVIWDDITNIQLNSAFKTCVSNLPFDTSIQILFIV